MRWGKWFGGVLLLAGGLTFAGEAPPTPVMIGTSCPPGFICIKDGSPEQVCAQVMSDPNLKVVCLTLGESAEIVGRMSSLESENQYLKSKRKRLGWWGEMGMRTGNVPNDSGLYGAGGFELGPPQVAIVGGVEAFSEYWAAKAALRIRF